MKLTACLSLSLTLALGACAAGDQFELEYESNLPQTFEEFEQTVYQEPITGVYIVNGDTPATSLEALYRFYLSLDQEGELAVYHRSGEDICWNGASRLQLTYCVSQRTFGSNYQRAVDGMNAAAAAWEAVSDVDFIHVAAEDGNCTNRNKNVVFDVQQSNTTQYLARAFFPNSNRRNRNVIVSTTVYPYDNDTSDPLTLVGVLRHELGHALGFRHEHTRPEAGTCFEDNNWRPLSPYDSSSVMHYPQCNGTGDWSLTLTADDSAGAADLYGAPGVGGGSCGTSTCDPVPEVCGDGIDNDCDGDIDAADSDCGTGECLPLGDSCSAKNECCSGSCGGPRFNRTCR